ncbi:Uncharacterised protein [Legionella donaldsonii]|uniref:Uncharacterized protein n=2 Tax=Legionella donaldsonii TaxID=45060 RepID=A0A378J8B6_9GAMM|nr:Uncharacterised protein [Legionella donaldsonii]
MVATAVNEPNSIKKFDVSFKKDLILGFSSKKVLNEILRYNLWKSAQEIEFDNTLRILVISSSDKSPSLINGRRSK